MPDHLETFAEMCAGWLGYRYPHWDALEREVSKRLTGSRTAVVRVGWDAAQRQRKEWHATLFTLANETPEPAAMLDAVKDHKPVGFVLQHVISETLPAEATPPADPRVPRLVGAVGQAFLARRRLDSLQGDVRAPQVRLEHARAQAENAVEEARVAVEHALTEGLMKRSGFLLIPPMVVKPAMIRDWVRYRVLDALRADLAPAAGDTVPWRPIGVAVCRACTTVFAPRRRSTAEYCDLCAKRPAVPLVLGQQPLPAGTRQTVRAPLLVGNVIRGWKTVTVGSCPDCSEPFVARRDALTCAECTNRARQRRHRERRSSS